MQYLIIIYVILSKSKIELIFQDLKTNVKTCIEILMITFADLFGCKLTCLENFIEKSRLNILKIKIYLKRNEH